MNYISTIVVVVSSVLADDYIPPYIASSPCQNVAGGDWILVRHANIQTGQGSGFTPATDRDNFGSYSQGAFGGSSASSYPNDPLYATSYSVPFKNYIARPSRIMFSDGLCNEYIVTTYDQIECGSNGDGTWILGNDALIAKRGGISDAVYVQNMCNNAYGPQIWFDGVANENTFYAQYEWPRHATAYADLRNRIQYSNLWIQMPGISNTLGADAIGSPVGSINVPEYVFYGTIASFLIVFMSLMICMVRMTKSGKYGYQKVNMQSETDIEN